MSNIIIYNIIQLIQQQHMTQQSNPPKTKPITKPKKSNSQPQTKIDKRFSSLQFDPKFKKPNINISKIPISPKFANKLKQKQFQFHTETDKYGRKNPKQDKMNNMNDYYYQQIPHQISNKTPQTKPKKNKTHKPTHNPPNQKNNHPFPEQNMNQDNQPQAYEQNISKWMQQYSQQSSQTDPLSQHDSPPIDTDSIWSDTTSNLIKGQEVEITNRLALCNYDWMNITAKDLMLLFSSFKPISGTILTVSVYYSEFGKQRINREDRDGPQGIWNNKQEEYRQGNTKGEKQHRNKKQWQNKNQLEEQAFNKKNLRTYQKQRLKYCYAVIECNTPKTSNQIYKQCDGNQFQNSNLTFDLRFIPDHIQFNPSMLKQKCNQIPIVGEIKNFINKSLGHTNVELSWENPEFNPIAQLKNRNWNTISEQQLNRIDWDNYLNEENQHNYNHLNKIITKTNQQSTKSPPQPNISQWRKQCTKSHKKSSPSNTQLQITFPSGFDPKPQPSLKLQSPSLNKQLKTRKQRWQLIKNQKKKKQQIELLVQNNKKQQFKYNPTDQRFNAVFYNSLYSIDPTNNKFDHRKIGKVFQEVVKRNKQKNLL